MRISSYKWTFSTFSEENEQSEFYIKSESDDIISGTGYTGYTVYECFSFGIMAQIGIEQ